MARHRHGRCPRAGTTVGELAGALPLLAFGYLAAAAIQRREATWVIAVGIIGGFALLRLQPWSYVIAAGWMGHAVSPKPEAVSLKGSVFRILQWMRKGLRKMKTLVVGVLACLFVAPAMAQAGQSQTTRGANGEVRVATLDELRRELRPGDLVSVVQITGDSVRGRLRRFGDTDIDIQAETQQAPPERRRPLSLKIPLSAIQALERPHDPLRNGALIGAGIGGGSALAVVVYAAAVDYNEIDEWGPTYLALGGLYTGLGALAGWAIDRARSKPHIRFDAPSPGTVTIRAVPLLSRGPGMGMALSF